MPLLSKPVVAQGTFARLAQPILESRTLVLRPWLTTDAPIVCAAYSDTEIQRWHMRSLDETEARQWIRAWADRWTAESGAGWAITDGSDVLGQISLRRLHLAEGLAEVSYWVLSQGRGRGVARTALRALTTWALDDMGLHRIEVQHSTRNPASCRVSESVGYALEGTKRSAAEHGDGWHDMHLHARIVDDAPILSDRAGHGQH